MTNKPTWEEEFDKKFVKCGINPDEKFMILHTADIPELKNFISLTRTESYNQAKDEMIKIIDSNKKEEPEKWNGYEDSAEIAGFNEALAIIKENLLANLKQNE